MNGLNIRCESMLGTTHSWAVTMRSLLKEFHKNKNEIYIKSINGYDFFPENVNYNRKNILNPDIDISYTLPRNFKFRFNKNSKLKLAIYNYETSILPEVWRDAHKHIDYALPSSNFSKEVFVNSGWPEEKCIVVPHGIFKSDFKDKRKVIFGTKKSFKFLNVSIPHYRKNIDILLDTYYSAFSSKDDVCLVLKTNLSKPKNYFEIDLKKAIHNIQKKHNGRTDLPQVEIVQKKFDSIIPLYNSCDCLVSASSAEGFGLPLLEALAAGMLVVSPRCSGQLDFLNDKNSLLYDTDTVSAEKEYQYWRASLGAKTYMPRKDDLGSAMISAYKNREKLKKDFSSEVSLTINKFTWENAAKKILKIS